MNCKVMFFCGVDPGYENPLSHCDISLYFYTYNKGKYHRVIKGSFLHGLLLVVFECEMQVRSQFMDVSTGFEHQSYM